MQAEFLKFVITGAVAVCALESPATGLGATTLFVATNGNDAWSGRLTQPNLQRTDGPLATVTGARDAVRRLRAELGANLGPVTVQVRGGTYRLAAPWVLEPQDSSTAAAPMVYEAYPGEQPVLSGGRVVRGWRQNGPLWQTEIPEVKAGRWYFQELFANAHRRQRARSPNAGYFRIANPAAVFQDEQGKELPKGRWGFGFKPGDLKPWRNPADAVIVLLHSWETSIHPIASIDTNANLVRFRAPLAEWWTIGYWEKAQRYYVENVFEALDQPGEWYLDRSSGVLSYYPLPDERLGAVEMVAPALTELVRLAGDAATGHWVRHLSLRGLALQHCDWTLSPQGNSNTQAAVGVPAAVMADGARNCVLENCEIAHTGGYGVWFRRGCQDCQIAHNRLHDLGAGGIRLGEAASPKSDAEESTRNLVDNNHIFDGGHVYPAGVGIWVAQSSHNRISHNEIHDLLYSGLSIGWNWNDAPNRCHDNLIEYNHVHDLVHGVLSDAGAIYTLGVSPGSVIRNNVFHDVWPYSTPPFGWGIYLDATCGGYLVESNVVYNTRSGGLMYNNGGHQHVIRNNIFAASHDFALWPYWEKRPNTFEHNIVWLNQGALFVTFAEKSLQDRITAKESLGVWDENLYWRAGPDGPLRFFRHSFAEWQALGLDHQSRIADPLFARPAAGDFGLPPQSPARDVGFQPIDTSTVGLYGDDAWVKEVDAGRIRGHSMYGADYFPPPESHGGWRKLDTPEAIRQTGGMDPAKLEELRAWLLASDDRDFAADVIHHGYIVLEVERGNSAVTDARRVASVSKAVCATVLAIASEQSQQGKAPRRMTLDDRAFDFIPWAQPLSDPRKARITVKQLLNHTSGICPEATGAPNDGSWEYILGHSGDPRTTKLAFDPGTACGYSTHALDHAALVCETVTGQPYDRFAIQSLFRPLGIEHWWFQYYEGGPTIGRHPTHGLGMPARDLARIAYCMLRGGRWGERQVVPRWFVEQTAVPSHQVRSPELRWKFNPQIFGLGWEIPRYLTGENGRSGKGIPGDARDKAGSGGQFIAFVPSLDLAVTRQTGSSGEWAFEEFLRRACAAVELGPAGD